MRIFQLIAHVRFTAFVIEISADGIYMTVVETVFDVLFPVSESVVVPVMEAWLVSDHDVAITLPVIVNDPDALLARLPAL